MRKGIGHAGGEIPPKLPLREHRLRAGVGLEAIVDATKLSRRFLEAIEEGAYQDLPGGVFSTSYIRQYAAATGYDADLILEHYRNWCGCCECRQELPDRKKAASVRWGKFVLFG